MSYNKYPSKCYYCNNQVAARAGELIGKRGGRGAVAHLACNQNKRASVSYTYFPSTDSTVYQNTNGRCIDAPCCGCCT